MLQTRVHEVVTSKVCEVVVVTEDENVSSDNCGVIVVTVDVTSLPELSGS